MRLGSLTFLPPERLEMANSSTAAAMAEMVPISTGLLTCTMLTEREMEREREEAWELLLLVAKE